jgi:hypothetical protein
MSQSASYTYFCKTYQLDPHSDHSKAEYKTYIDNPGVANQVFADDIYQLQI